MVFTELEPSNAFLQMFLTVAIVTYGTAFATMLCARSSNNLNAEMNELVGKTENVLYSDPLDTPEEGSSPSEEGSPTEEIKERLLSKVDIPIIQEELEELKKNYTFGIQRWKDGPFLEFTDLTFTNGKLYCIRNNKKLSVAKCVEETKRTTRPRWIHHLCFLQDGEPVLFRDYLWEKHGLTFS